MVTDTKFLSSESSTPVEYTSRWKRRSMLVLCGIILLIMARALYLYIPRPVTQIAAEPLNYVFCMGLLKPEERNNLIPGVAQLGEEQKKHALLLLQEPNGEYFHPVYTDDTKVYGLWDRPAIPYHLLKFDPGEIYRMSEGIQDEWVTVNDFAEEHRQLLCSTPDGRPVLLLETKAEGGFTPYFKKLTLQSVRNGRLDILFQSRFPIMSWEADSMERPTVLTVRYPTYSDIYRWDGQQFKPDPNPPQTASQEPEALQDEAYLWLTFFSPAIILPAIIIWLYRGIKFVRWKMTNRYTSHARLRRILIQCMRFFIPPLLLFEILLHFYSHLVFVSLLDMLGWSIILYAGSISNIQQTVADITTPQPQLQAET